MIKPTIHLNGSSAETLAHGYTEAIRRVADALEGLARCAPNARDYYVQGDHAFAAASREHLARVAKLEEVLVEVSVLRDHVEDEQSARAARRAGR